MKSPIFSFCEFHLARLWRSQPIAVLAVSASLLAALLSGLTYVDQLRKVDEAEGQLQRLAAEVRRKPAPVATTHTAAPDLPAFTSAEFVHTVNQIAADLGIPFDEVSYRMEVAASMPYLRYRVTFSTAAKYPLIRRFIDQMAMNLPHSTLDEISCSRDDLPAAALSCDLSFSAFFRKDGHG